VEAQELDERKKALDEKSFVRPLPASRLRVTLPLDHALAEPGRLRDWALGFSLVRSGPVFSAYAGYALNYYKQAVESDLYGPAQKLLASACLRHPGFDWDGGGLLPRILRFAPDPPCFLPLVKRAAWLNLLCDRTIRLLGGRDQVRSRLRDEPGIVVADLDHGLAIQAGPAPEIGDVGRHEFMPLLRRVARELRPVRVEDIAGLGGGFMRRATNDWLNAFDKTYD
jgi:hypothetical protein